MDDDRVEAWQRAMEADPECFDRFTFDQHMRYLLASDLDHEEAKDWIMWNCSLSMLVMQERIVNRSYRKVRVDQRRRDDLQEMLNEAANELFKKRFRLS